MRFLDLTAGAMLALGLVLVIASIFVGQRVLALVGVGCWAAATALLIGKNGPHGRAH